MLRILKLAALYFALVFSAGFVLGTIRTLWVVPKLGVRTAELMEAPMMFAISVLAARWIVRRPAAPSTLTGHLSVGLIALAFLLSAELAFVRWLRGMSLREYFATRDPGLRDGLLHHCGRVRHLAGGDGPKPTATMIASERMITKPYRPVPRVFG